MDHSFFVQALIYLGSAVLLVPLCKKLGLGSVLGYLIAGILIGPSCFALIGNDGADIMHFAEFGVVMMLFLVGLELQPARLWNMRAQLLGLGGLQLLVTALAIMLNETTKSSANCARPMTMSSSQYSKLASSDHASGCSSEFQSVLRCCWAF